jgi:hypothetical protein
VLDRESLPLDQLQRMTNRLAAIAATSRSYTRSTRAALPANGSSGRGESI